jgi:predicted nucleic acid-binding protein
MSEFLLDTCILIDVLRNDPRAIDYFRKVSLAGVASLHAVSVAELVQGASDAKEQRKVLNLARQVPWIYPSDMDAHAALADFCDLHLARQIEFLDCLIASTALRMRSKVSTHNVRHFRQFPSLQVIRPY